MNTHVGPRRVTKGSVSSNRRRSTKNKFTARKNTRYRESVYSVQTIKSTRSTKSEKKALTSEKVEFALQNKKCTRPRGLLAVHVKKLNLESVEMYKLFKKYNATMYVRMSCQGQVKCTTAYHNITCPSSTLLDELKHFRLRLSSRKLDPTNFFRFELIACPSTPGDHTHRVISLKDVHLYDIVKSLFSVDPIVWRTDDKQIGELDVEICFAYGTFGYGFSSQFVNKKKTLQENIAHSMFCYAEPPEGREDYSLDVMTCRHIGHPNFIDFKHKVDIGIAAFSDDISTFPEIKTKGKKPRLVLSKIRKPLQDMQKEYGSQPSRMARLEYLRRKVSQPGISTELDNGNFEAHPGEYKLRYSNLLMGSSESEHKLSHATPSKDIEGMYSSRDVKNLQSSSHETTPVKRKGMFGGMIAGLVSGWVRGRKKSDQSDTEEELDVENAVVSKWKNASSKVAINIDSPSKATRWSLFRSAKVAPK